jgi:hypothetical protein
MKTKLSAGIVSGAALAIVCAIGIHSPQISSAQEPPVPMPAENVQTSATVSPPPDILPASPLAEVIKLTQSGVDESVIMAYIQNSGSTFNLDSDKIIYLSNIGAPNDLVTAMMQRDQFLQQQITAAISAQQAAQTAQATQPATPPDYSTDDETAPPEVTADYFNTSLAPYGSWTQVPGYGRCWRPTITFYDTAWQPYCDRGHWVYTDCGWYWDSDYSWGATFHYGRWFRDENLGWCWSPDTVWAPSWVCWRYSDDYCGWAPLPPGAVFQSGVGFVYRGRNVSAGFDFGLRANAFTFVLTKNFSDMHPRNFRAAPSETVQIYNHTTVINNFNARNRTVVNNGIPFQHIAAATHSEIHPVPVREIIGTDARNRQNHFPENNPNPAVSVQMQHTSPLDAPKNQGHSITVYNPGNNGGQHVEIPAQNHFSPPPEIQNDTRAAIPQKQIDVPETHHNFNPPRTEPAPDDSRPSRSELQNAPAVQPHNDPKEAPAAPQPQQRSGGQSKNPNWPGN